MGEGRSPRSVARAGGVRSRLLPLSRPVRASPGQPGGRSAARRARGRRCRNSCRSRKSIGCCRRRTRPQPRGLRDRALIELLYATGLRVSEMVEPAPAGSESRERLPDDAPARAASSGWCPIGDEAAAWLTRYLTEARPALLKRRASPRLFVNARGGAGLTRVGFWKILKELRQAGRAARARSARTCCGIRSRRICSSAAPTCARSR